MEREREREYHYMLPDSKSNVPILALNTIEIFTSSTSQVNSLEESSISLVWKPEVPAVLGLTKAEPLPLHRSRTYKDDERNLQKTWATIQQ